MWIPAILVAVAGLAFGAAFVAHERAEVAREWRARLSAMADDRQRAIEQWVAEREGDAGMVAAFPATRAVVGDAAASRRAGLEAGAAIQALHDLLARGARAHGYRGVWVVKGDLVVARSPGARDLGPDDLDAARRVADGRHPLGGFVRRPDGAVVLTAVWVAGPAAAAGRGLVVLESDPAQVLYPLLAAQPFASETGESLLVGRDGDAVVFLAPLRHRAAVPLEFRTPVRTPSLAARAALGDGSSFGEFVDYRGAHVLAAVRRIRSRPWGIVVKVDRDEAFAAFRTEMWLLAAAATLGVLALVAVTVGIQRAERLEAEARIARTEARLGSLVDQAEDVIFFLDADGRLLDVNRRAEQVYGYTREELRGLPARVLRPPEMRAEVDERVAETLRQGSARFEAIHQRKDGTRFPVEVNARRVDTGDGQVIVAIVRDMSAWKAQQAALDESRTRLAATEQQLWHAQKLEAVGRLAAGVAHDFNNLLTVITGYGRLVADSLPAEDPRRAEMDEILSAADRATHLTRQLLAFGRRQVLQPRVLDLNAVVAGVVQMLERLIGEDIRVVVRTEAALGRVEVDPRQIEHVLMNLAVNARDAMPEGGTLTIETANVVLTGWEHDARGEGPRGEYVMLAVSDTGVGMDAETQARVFEPFFTTKPEGKGTGLGLSTVYGIVKQSGGSIWLESAPGRGTTFRLYFPRVDEPLHVGGPGAPAAASARAAGGETVLVVEDEAAVREVVRRVLEAQGYRVWVAANAREALEAIERGASVDLLVTDLVMPEMSGVDVWRRARSAKPALPVVFTSGYAEETGEVLRVPEGAQFLSKPFTPDELLDVVEAALGRSHPQP